MIFGVHEHVLISLKKKKEREREERTFWLKEMSEFIISVSVSVYQHSPEIHY